MATNPGRRFRQSWSIAMTPLSAARSAFGLSKTLDEAGWHVIPTSNAASLAESALVCVVILSPQTVSDPQVIAALSARFAILIPVVTAPMTLPDAPWSCEAFSLSALDAQQAATGAAIGQKLTELLPAISLPTHAAIQPQATPVTPHQPPAQTSPAPAPAWASAAPEGGGEYGRLIGDYPAKPSTYLYIPLGVIFLLMGLTGWAPGGEWNTSSRWILAIFGVVCFGAYYLNARGAHAQLFERGFVIARAGNVASGRWEDVIQMASQARRWYLFGFIPIPGTARHDYVMFLRNGSRVVLHNAYFSRVDQLMSQATDAIKRSREQASATPPGAPAS